MDWTGLTELIAAIIGFATRELVGWIKRKTN